MRITIISEDTAHGRLIAEHGFCALIEPDDGEPILLDTGQGMALRYNAPLLGVDLSKIHKIAISHGHYDHTGGLGYLISIPHERSLEIYLHPKALGEKLVKDKAMQYRYIGMSVHPGALRFASAFLMMNTEPVEIQEGIRLTGEIPRRCEFEPQPKDFFELIVPDLTLAEDVLMDDQSLIVDLGSEFALISGCAHAGIVNTLEYTMELTGKKPMIVVGGTHLVDASDERISRTIERFKEIDVRRVALGHCTGWKALRAFEEAYGEEFIRLHAGLTVEI
jgi:7,8-dihydropterin-6-yl-methyl-4-(beta-D-ribofuranosyl)aminobenzene 5'-phosphate synthase